MGRGKAGAVESWMLTVIAIAVMAVSSTLFMALPQGHAPGNPSRIASLVPHAPISIDGDNAFALSDAVSGGNGSESDPYLIEGWDIDASSASSGILIQNTSARFIVRSCSIHDAGLYDAGILLLNCTDGLLMDNTCLRDSYGIYLANSDDITLSGNNCSNGDWGVYLESSSNCNLINNSCWNNTYGMGLLSSSNDTLSDNICNSNNQWGMGLFGSSDNALSGNLCSDNAVGIALGESNNNTLSANNCSMNIGDGIGTYLSCNNTLYNNNCSSNAVDGIAFDSGSDNNTISANNCSSNGHSGIQLYSCSGNVVIWNQMYSNSGFGVFLDAGCLRTAVFQNTFFENNGTGTTFDPGHVQACDIGADNWWNSSDGFGNYWSDWTTPDADHDGIVDQAYDIAGSAGARDFYPMTTVQQIPEFGIMPLLVIVLVMMISVMRAARRKLR